MPRIRALKPEFFKDEDLCVHPPWVRILFAGLWIQADREGRLEDRPKKLAAEIFPYDKFDIEKGLSLLCISKKYSPKHNPFIIRYEISGEKYIQILNFGKHQTPHYTEKDSIIPRPPSNNSGSTPGVPQEDLGGGQSPHSPKSMNLIHESLLKWNDFAQKWNLQKIQEIKPGSTRERHLLARVNEKDFNFPGLLAKIEKQPFLLGENKQAWTITFDWIICPSNYTKIMEEQYPARASRDDVAKDRRVGATKRPTSDEEKRAQEEARAEFQAKVGK